MSENLEQQRLIETPLPVSDLENQNNSEVNLPSSKKEEETLQKQNSNIKKNTKKKKKNYMLAFFERLLTGIVVAWALLTFVFDIVIVKGNYMYPALRDGDLTITFKIGEPVSSETVAYVSPDGRRLGRIVAMEGDEVNITDDGYITVNGIGLTEEIFYPTTVLNNTVVNFPYIVPSDSVFILNDYRSLEDPDSRVYGAIQRKKLRGKLIFLFRRRGF